MPDVTKLWLMLLPELGRFPIRDQAQALKKAGETELDILELVGVAFALVLVTVATQYALPDRSLPSRFAAALLNFIVAVPLIAVAVAPFHIRRLRRGLRSQLKQLEQEHE
jgi:hypothetical protein